MDLFHLWSTVHDIWPESGAQEKKERGKERDREEGKIQAGRKRGRKGGKEDKRQEERKERKREGKKGRAEERRKSALYRTSRQLASRNRTDLISCWIKQTRSMPGVKSYSLPHLNISLVQTSFSHDPPMGSQPLRMKDYCWFDLHKACFFYPNAQSVVLWTEQQPVSYETCNPDEALLIQMTMGKSLNLSEASS